MKNKLLILVVSIFLFGCSKSGDSPNDTSASILGTWEFQSRTHTYVSGYIDPVLGTEIETYWETDTYTVNDTVKEYMVYRYNNTLSWYMFSLDTLLYRNDFTYEKDGNELIIDNTLHKITTLTNNNLSYSWYGNDQWDQWEGDTTFLYVESYVFQCIKSELPSITTEPLNKKKSVIGYNSFLNRRENR